MIGPGRPTKIGCFERSGGKPGPSSWARVMPRNVTSRGRGEHVDSLAAKLAEPAQDGGVHVLGHIVIQLERILNIN